MTDDAARRLVRVRELAAAWDVPERTVYDMIAKGRMPAYRISPRSIRVDPDEALTALRQEVGGLRS